MNEIVDLVGLHFTRIQICCLFYVNQDSVFESEHPTGLILEIRTRGLLDCTHPVPVPMYFSMPVAGPVRIFSGPFLYPLPVVN